MTRLPSSVLTDESAKRRSICRCVVYFQFVTVAFAAAAGWLDAFGHRFAFIPEGFAAACIFIGAGGLWAFPAFLLTVVLASQGLPVSTRVRIYLVTAGLAVLHCLALLPLVQ